MSVSTHTDQMRALIYTVAHTHTAQTRSLALNWNHLCLKNSWTTAISASLDTSAGLLWIFQKFLPTCIQWLHWPQPCVISQKKKGKNPKALPLIRRGPLKVLGCILTLQDLEQLQVLSSCLTNSPLHCGLLADTLPQPFPLSHRCLMQKTKCLRGLLNIQYLNCLTIIFFFNGPFKDSISEWMQRMAIEERALRDAEEEE